MIHVRTRTPNAKDPASPVVPSAFEYLYRDHPGSVEAVTDEAGAELAVLGHDPYEEWREARERAPGEIRAHYVRGAPLSVVQDLVPFLPEAAGTRIEHPYQYTGPFWERHCYLAFPNW